MTRSKTPASLVRDEVRALTAYHVLPAEGLVKLDAMENPYRLPPELAARMGNALAEVAVNRYPDPTAPRLKRALRGRERSDPDGLEVPTS
jgi:histidinol-phosphate aminotransferase